MGQGHADVDELAGPYLQPAQGGLPTILRIEVTTVPELLKQGRTLFGHMRELLQPLHIVRYQQGTGLIDEIASGGRISRYQTLIFRGERYGRNLADDIPHVQGIATVDTCSVGASRRDGHLIGMPVPVIFHVCADGCRGAASLDKRQ